jgi:PilZ domain-containing protein
MANQEARRHERFRGTLTVAVSGDGTQRFGTIYEVSMGGAFLEVSPLPQVGAVVNIQIVEGGERRTLIAEVRYRENSDIGARGVEGVGVAWKELNPEGRALVERLVGRAQLGKPLRGT